MVTKKHKPTACKPVGKKGKDREIHTKSERKFAQLFAKVLNGKFKGPVTIQLD